MGTNRNRVGNVTEFFARGRSQSQLSSPPSTPESLPEDLSDKDLPVKDLSDSVLSMIKQQRSIIQQQNANLKDSIKIIHP